MLSVVQIVNLLHAQLTQVVVLTLLALGANSSYALSFAVVTPDTLTGHELQITTCYPVTALPGGRARLASGNGL